jgi:hypothetical protein
MKIKLGKFMFVAAILLCFIVLNAPVASADGEGYAFAGTGVLAGTDFTYDSSSGFLSYSATELTQRPQPT